MLKRTVRHLAVTGITIVSATMLTTQGAPPPPLRRPLGYEGVRRTAT
jgi:hypothetical protein